ncbi:hypothetical protein LCGC14_0384290 [marine sediment metagenome]|uniref:Terminase large subunit gp17-like C-terminal domain-containing protein n=1 Tax=marine sediment metagenome TaxID=412755 RepID=A0A0F9T1A2_9ZZZZ
MAVPIYQNPLYRPDPIYEQLLASLESERESKQKEVLREYCVYDLYFLAKYILGHWWLCWDPHKEFAEEIEKEINMELFLLHRGSCKTIIFNTSDSIRQYLKEPDQPIAIFCDLSKRAKWKLRPIRYQFERNATLKWLWREILWDEPEKESDTWTESELFLPGRPEGQEPSIGVYGLDAMPTSLHFPKIKGDDLVTDKTVTTAAQIGKSLDNYGSVRSSILMPTGTIQICGTIYDDGDLHRTMEDSAEYTVYKRPAEWTEIDDDGVKHHKTFWPVQFGPEKLAAIKRDPAVSIYIYSCQYLQDPVPEDENAYFQLKWFGRYNYEPWPKVRPGLNMFAAADLAISEKKTACETAIVVGGIDWNYELFIVHVAKGHWDAGAIVDNILDIQARYHPGIFTIEAENIQKTIMPFLRLKMRETGIFPNVDPRLPMGDKIAKGRSFQGRAKEGAVHLPAKGRGAAPPDWLPFTELQIRRFPKGKDKDVADSISLLCHQLDDQWRPATKEELEARAQEEYVPLEAAIGM